MPGNNMFARLHPTATDDLPICIVCRHGVAGFYMLCRMMTKELLINRACVVQ
jgi:hypothetical protein